MEGQKVMRSMISLPISEELAIKARVEAARRGQSRSAFVRDAIRHYMHWLKEQERAAE